MQQEVAVARAGCRLQTQVIPSLHQHPPAGGAGLGLLIPLTAPMDALSSCKMPLNPQMEKGATLALSTKSKRKGIGKRGGEAPALLQVCVKQRAGAQAATSCDTLQCWKAAPLLPACKVGLDPT